MVYPTTDTTRDHAAETCPMTVDHLRDEPVKPDHGEKSCDECGNPATLRVTRHGKGNVVSPTVETYLCSRHAVAMIAQEPTLFDVA